MHAQEHAYTMSFYFQFPWKENVPRQRTGLGETTIHFYRGTYVRTYVCMYTSTLLIHIMVYKLARYRKQLHIASSPSLSPESTFYNDPKWERGSPEDFSHMLDTDDVSWTWF